MNNGPLIKQSRWMIRLSFIACIFAFLLAACSKAPASSPEELASASAKSSYEALYNHHPELFLNGRAGANEMPQSYRHQLLDAYRLHTKEVDGKHQGVKRITVSHAQRDSTLQLIQVFLMLEYGDSTREEIVVPMVEHHGQWLMK